MTDRQGKLIALALIIAVMLTVGAIAVFHQGPKPVHVSTPAELVPGPTEVVFTTAKGPLAFELYPKLAPLHVAQFLRLVAAGVYDGATVIRIERGFVVQIDATYERPIALSKAQQDLITTIPAEFSDVKHFRRTLSMARYDDVDSATTSFSILLGPAPHLDAKYTVFGRMLEESEETLRQLETAAIKPGTTKPAEPILITKAEIRSKKIGPP